MRLLALIKFEFKRHFCSPYVFYALSLITAGERCGFQWLLGRFNELKNSPWGSQSLGLTEAIFHPIAACIATLLLISIPFLTSPSISEERKHHTLELYALAGVPSHRLIWAKFIALSLGFTILLVALLALPLSVWLTSQLDLGQIAATVIGLELLVLVLCALGLMCSSCTQNASLAGLSFSLSLVTTIVLGALWYPMRLLSPIFHLQVFLDGRISSSSLCSACSLIMAGLAVAHYKIDGERLLA